MIQSPQNGHSFGPGFSGMSPKSQYATTLDPFTVFFTFAMCAFVMPPGDVMKMPFSYLLGGTHSLPCGPWPAFWQILPPLSPSM